MPPTRLYNAPVEQNPKPDHVLVPTDLWEDLLEFVQNHVDALDGDDGQPRPTGHDPLLSHGASMKRRTRITLEILWDRKGWDDAQFKGPEEWNWGDLLHADDPMSPVKDVRVLEHVDITPGAGI